MIKPTFRLAMAASTMIFMGVAAYASAPADTVGRVLDNVIVTGVRNQTDIRHLPMTLSTINRRQLTDAQRLNLLPTLAEEVPGLMVTQRGMLGFGVSDGAAGGINLRGLGSGGGRLMVLIDGHPQYQGIFGHSIGDAYQTMLAERVEVLRGPASVIYGSNAMGGVVNIVTRRMPSDGVKTDIKLAAGSYGTVMGELVNRLRSGRFSSVVAAQYARSDNHRRDMGFEQYGGYVKLGYDFTANWRAYTDLNLTHFNASYPGSTLSPVFGARQWITRGVATAVLENNYRNTSGAISVYHNFGRHKINDGYESGEEPPTAYFRSADALTGVSVYQSATFFADNRITLGFDYQHIYGKAWNEDMTIRETTNTIGHYHENEVAAYLDVRQDLLSWLTIDAGARIDNHSQSGTELVPQCGLVARLIHNGELKAMVAKGFRNPTIREMYFWRPANADLKPERMVNYELSWRQRLLNDALSYGVNVFYINGDNMIQTVMTDGRPQNVNTGAIENSGVELDLRWVVSPQFTLNGDYSYLHQHNPVIGAPTHKAHIGATYDHNKWRLHASLQHIAGLYTAVGSAEEKQGFTLLNAMVAYKACPLLTLWAKGENLLAQRYETQLGYPMPRATFLAGVNISF